MLYGVGVVLVADGAAGGGVVGGDGGTRGGLQAQMCFAAVGRTLSTMVVVVMMMMQHAPSGAGIVSCMRLRQCLRQQNRCRFVCLLGTTQ